MKKRKFIVFKINNIISSKKVLRGIKLVLSRKYLIPFCRWKNSIINKVGLLAAILFWGGWLHIRRMTDKERIHKEYAKKTERYTGGNFWLERK